MVSTRVTLVGRDRSGKVWVFWKPKTKLNIKRWEDGLSHVFLTVWERSNSNVLFQRFNCSTMKITKKWMMWGKV